MRENRIHFQFHHRFIVPKLTTSKPQNTSLPIEITQKLTRKSQIANHSLAQVVASMNVEIGESSDYAKPVAPDTWRSRLDKKFQYYLDRSAPHLLWRWLVTLGVAMIYILRVYWVKGFHVVSYGLATYVLNLLIGFLSPKIDPELEVFDGPLSPRKESGEYKPFERRLPEFRLWYSITKAFMVSFLMSFISFLDVPVFWPILLSYWAFLFGITMWRQIIHMIKYKYNPFSPTKPQYLGKKSPVGSSDKARSESTKFD